MARESRASTTYNKTIDVPSNKAQGIPDFQAPPPIPKFIDTVKAIDELPSYGALDPASDDL